MLHVWYNNSNIKFIFHNKPFKVSVKCLKISLLLCLQYDKNVELLTCILFLCDDLSSCLHIKGSTIKWTWNTWANTKKAFIRHCTIYLVIFLASFPGLFKYSERLLIQQKLILKSHSKNNPCIKHKNIFQKIYCLKRV